ncbi:MAG: hypothetical protein PHH26_05565, partial [Candidatus Thermoplasmatota archaeon]|nr:hypothetical protein [Candidatus Thermoplasmatota archaeon]
LANAGTSVELGKRLCVVGYHTSFNPETGVSDMDKGQQYYQGPYDSLANGVDTTKAVELIASAQTSDFILVQSNFCQLRNFYIHGTPEGYDLLNLSHQDTQYFEAYGCKFGTTGKSIVADWYTGASFPRGIVFEDCLFDPQITTQHGVVVAGGGCVIFTRCIFNGQDHPTGPMYTFSLRVAAGSQVAVHNSYFYNGDAGIFPDQGAHADVRNCTLLDQKHFCIGVQKGIAHVTNSILVPRASGYVGGHSTGGSSILDYNVYWSMANEAPQWWTAVANPSTVAPPKGVHSITANPNIVFKPGIGPVPTSPLAIRMKAGANCETSSGGGGRLRGGRL